VPSHNPDPAQQLETDELAARLRKAIAQLPQQHAEVFCLRYLNGMSYRLIAKQLGIKTSAAGVSLHRARARLRMLLESAFVAEADFGGVGKTPGQEESEDSYDTGKEPAD
jgi:RNA polymerase sigma-70 factor (ECF subfamily)